MSSVSTQQLESSGEKYRGQAYENVVSDLGYKVVVFPMELQLIHHQGFKDEYLSTVCTQQFRKAYENVASDLG